MPAKLRRARRAKAVEARRVQSEERRGERDRQASFSLSTIFTLPVYPILTQPIMAPTQAEQQAQDDMENDQLQQDEEDLEGYGLSPSCLPPPLSQLLPFVNPTCRRLSWTKLIFPPLLQPLPPLRARPRPRPSLGSFVQRAPPLLSRGCTRPHRRLTRLTRSLSHPL